MTSFNGTIYKYNKTIYIHNHKIQSHKHKRIDTIMYSTSPSELLICVISRSSVNVSLAIPSKHFFKCGCTLVGSLVSESISSISSLERKKKRGKYNLFFSRYSLRPYDHSCTHIIIKI